MEENFDRVVQERAVLVGLNADCFDEEQTATEETLEELEDLLETVFILNMDTRFLRRADCKGLCSRCGKNLNEGPCDCRPDTDPRLAVLEQLLDDKH